MCLYEIESLKFSDSDLNERTTGNPNKPCMKLSLSTAMISVKKKTSEVHVINKKTSARTSKKEAELHEFLEQYLRIFRAISTSNPTYSEYIVHIFQHHTKHILSILECGSGFCIAMLGTSHFRKKS